MTSASSHSADYWHLCAEVWPLISCRLRSMPVPLRQVEGLVRGELGPKKSGIISDPAAKADGRER